MLVQFKNRLTPRKVRETEMASYTNRLTGHPNVFVEQNIWSNGELMGFSPINVMWDGRNAPTLLCRYTFDGGQYYSLQVSPGRPHISMLAKVRLNGLARQSSLGCLVETRQPLLGNAGRKGKGQGGGTALPFSKIPIAL